MVMTKLFGDRPCHPATTALENDDSNGRSIRHRSTPGRYRSTSTRGNVLRPEQVAEQAGTITHELLVRLGRRVQRIFVEP